MATDTDEQIIESADESILEANLLDYRSARWGEISEAPTIMAYAMWAAQNNTPITRAVINSREFLSLSMYEWVIGKIFSHFAASLYYASGYGGVRVSRKIKKPMDIDKMIAAWVPLVKQLATAHNIDERDLASSSLDEYLTPLIAAPVAQIRDFYRRLIQALKDDSTIPWAVWKLFEVWGREVLDKITSEQEVKLKTEIAERIARSSINKIPVEDWVQSMVGALQWRSPETLEKVEKAIEAGETPRVRGKDEGKRAACLCKSAGTR
jgi:hypothetical protein